MVSLVALIVWRLHFLIVLSGFLVFATLDGIYLSSALTKVPDGAWFTLGLAVILSSIFVLWRFGKENQWHAEAEDRIPPSHLLTELPDDPKSAKNGLSLRLAPELSGAPISRLRGIGIFFDKTGGATGTPTVFVHFLQKFQATAAVVVFFHIRPLSTPTVAPEERFSVSRCFPLTKGSEMALRHMYRVTIRHGYLDNVLTSDLGLLIYENLRDFIIREGAEDLDAHPATTAAAKDLASSSESSSSSTSHPLPTTTTANTITIEREQATIRQNLNVLQSAYEDQIVYIVGKEQMRISEAGSGNPLKAWTRRLALAAFLWLRSNTGSRVANMDLDMEKLVEVGFVKVI